MKGARKQYPKATYLELENAMSIRDYAKQEGIQIAGVYKRYTYKHIRIVDFCGYNFVVPNEKKLVEN